MTQTQTVPVERVRFAWAGKSAPTKQLKIRLTSANENKDHSSLVKKRLKRFLIHLRSD